MNRSCGHIASTDYTIQYSLMQFCGFLGMGAGGFLGERFGTTILFILVPVLMTRVLAVTPRAFDREDAQPPPGP